MTPIPTSHPQKIMLRHVESRAREPAKADVQLGSYKNMQKDKEFFICAILKESNILGSNLEFKSLKNWRGRFLNCKVNFLFLFISLLPWLFCKTCSYPELCLISPPSTMPLIVLCALYFILQASLVPIRLGAIDPSAFPPCVSTFTE